MRGRTLTNPPGDEIITRGDMERYSNDIVQLDGGCHIIKNYKSFRKITGYAILLVVSLVLFPTVNRTVLMGINRDTPADFVFFGNRYASNEGARYWFLLFLRLFFIGGCYSKVWFNTSPDLWSAITPAQTTQRLPKFGIKPDGIINFLSNEPPFRPTQRLRYCGACSPEAHLPYLFIANDIKKIIINTGEQKIIFKYGLIPFRKTKIVNTGEIREIAIHCSLEYSTAPTVAKITKKIYNVDLIDHNANAYRINRSMNHDRDLKNFAVQFSEIRALPKTSVFRSDPLKKACFVARRARNCIGTGKNNRFFSVPITHIPVNDKKDAANNAVFRKLVMQNSGTPAGGKS